MEMMYGRNTIHLARSVENPEWGSNIAQEMVMQEVGISPETWMTLESSLQTKSRREISIQALERYSPEILHLAEILGIGGNMVWFLYDVYFGHLHPAEKVVAIGNLLHNIAWGLEDCVQLPEKKISLESDLKEWLPDHTVKQLVKIVKKTKVHGEHKIEIIIPLSALLQLNVPPEIIQEVVEHTARIRDIVETHGVDVELAILGNYPDSQHLQLVELGDEEKEPSDSYYHLLSNTAVGEFFQDLGDAFSVAEERLYTGIQILIDAAELCRKNTLVVFPKLEIGRKTKSLVGALNSIAGTKVVLQLPVPGPKEDVALEEQPLSYFDFYPKTMGELTDRFSSLGAILATEQLKVECASLGINPSWVHKQHSRPTLVGIEEQPNPLCSTMAPYAPELLKQKLELASQIVQSLEALSHSAKVCLVTSQYDSLVTSGVIDQAYLYFPKGPSALFVNPAEKQAQTRMPYSDITIHHSNLEKVLNKAGIYLWGKYRHSARAFIHDLKTAMARSKLSKQSGSYSYYQLMSAFNFEFTARFLTAGLVTIHVPYLDDFVAHGVNNWDKLISRLASVGLVHVGFTGRKKAKATPLLKMLVLDPDTGRRRFVRLGIAKASQSDSVLVNLDPGKQLAKNSYTFAEIEEIARDSLAQGIPAVFPTKNLEYILKLLGYTNVIILDDGVYWEPYQRAGVLVGSVTSRKPILFPYDTTDTLDYTDWDDQYTVFDYYSFVLETQA